MSRVIVRVKICGVTRLEDALAAAAAGADAVGFNFWPGSRRFVSPGAARAIASRLPPFVTAVGVFVNQDPAEVRRACLAAGCAAAQLHGDEPPADAAAVGLPVLKAFRLAAPGDLRALDRWPGAAVLLDAPSEGYGGSGRGFDWSLARRAVEAGRTVVLSGGLAPENVAAAVRAVRPWAVDVASGVESSPGVKDRELVARFVRAAKEVPEP
ncbi:MAG TPA: phosphoribosylanthranilate isomerase [Anaeromyxobacteraceae bacterium]|jgi:phosphoribosylanthranilate isomerase